jgi:curved DNA-binding protein CbpA
MNMRWLLWHLLYRSLASVVMARTVPEATSTLLKMHKLYQQQAPHDTALYDALEVAPNATSAQISRSYRSLSRRYHPDKSPDREEKLLAVQNAYSILKEDASRLPYHQYGLTEVSDAAFLLTGARSPKTLSADQEKLLRLMGYLPDQKLSYEERILFLAANLVERMRPLVEDVISTSAMVDSIAQECAVLKKLPLGAQILRCIGRAYRRAGQQVLRRERYKLAGEITNALQSYKHKTQHLLEAAAVGSRLMLTEKKQEDRKSDTSNVINAQGRLEYHFLEDEDLDDNVIKEAEHEKSKKVQLESLQVEALWKVSKIHLDRAISDSCHHVLDGKYFFFPSHASSNALDWSKGGDGWVSSKGQAISASAGRLRAALALVLIGDTFVKCAKEAS